MIIHDYSLSEARRKKQYRRHVSREDTYDEDMTHHNYGDAILSDIGEVMKLMASGQDTTLTSDTMPTNWMMNLEVSDQFIFILARKKTGPRMW